MNYLVAWITLSFLVGVLIGCLMRAGDKDDRRQISDRRKQVRK